jgi:outer membrane biosynthesis protein TonB
MDGTPERRTEQHDARHRRIWRAALLASVLLHILIFMIFRRDVVIPPSPFAAAGPKSGDARAAAGGGTRIVALTVVETPPEPVVEVEVPVPVPTPDPEVQLVVEEPPAPQPAVAAAAVQGTGVVGEGRGDRRGEGIVGGTGRGDGGTAEEGLFRVVPPSPRGLILPPSDRPGKVRGKEVDVWVFVTATGSVVDDSTRIAPTTGDRRFDDRLKKQAGEWVFEPARRGGSPVAEWFRYTIIL